MAQTLTNETNLRTRQAALERELLWLKRIRVIEWGGAILFALIGLALRQMGVSAASFVLFIAGVLVFLALGHEARRREQIADLADTANLREVKEKFAQLLDEKLANDHYVLNDLHLIVGREKCWIDHLVVAPSGMFVIDILNWDGTIVGDTGKQVHTWKIRTPDGKVRPARNPVGRTLRGRRILGNWLKGTNLIWERVFPLVVLANPEADIQVTNAARRVFTPAQAVTFINDFCFEKPVLSKDRKSVV